MKLKYTVTLRYFKLAKKKIAYFHVFAILFLKHSQNQRMICVFSVVVSTLLRLVELTEAGPNHFHLRIMPLMTKG